MAKVIAIWGVVAIASAIVAGIVAGAKRRDHSFWAAWSFLVPPMLLILLLMPGNKGPLSFSFPPFHDAANQRTGPVPVFVELCAFLDPELHSWHRLRRRASARGPRS